MRRLALVLVIAIAMLLLPATLAFAATTGTQGQPSQTCGSSTAPSTPGHASSASGSAFNPNGKAGSVYAGQQTQNSGNSHSVSQYDVACFETSQ